VIPYLAFQGGRRECARRDFSPHNADNPHLASQAEIPHFASQAEIPYRAHRVDVPHPASHRVDLPHPASDRVDLPHPASDRVDVPHLARRVDFPDSWASRVPQRPPSNFATRLTYQK